MAASRRRNMLGIDLGTSSVKAVVIDEQGRVLGAGSREYPIDIPRPGWAEQSPEVWWQSTVQAVRQAVAQGGVPVHAVSLCGQMHGGALMGADDRPVGPAIIWPDQRSAEEVRLITSRIGAEKLAAIAGTAPACGFLAPTLLWIKRHDPARLEKTRYCLQPKDYLRLRITGEAAAETSDASATALFDINRRRWSLELIRSLKLPERLFPKVLNSFEPAGRVSRGAADALSLEPGTPVVAGSADQVAQAVGNGLLDPGETFIALGSGGQIVVPVGKPVADRKLRLHCFCHGPADRWYVLGAMLTAGLSLRWLRDLLELPKEGNAYEHLSALARSVAPGAGSLFFLPYLAGERSPIMDPKARGCFIGLTLGHSRAHLARAIMEGVCFAFRQILETVEANEVAVGRLLVAGKGLDNPVWRQILADVLGRPLYRRAGSEKTAFGAALIAGIGAGIYGGYTETRAITGGQAEVTEPAPENAETYARLYERYRRIYPRLRGLFARMSEER